MNPNSSAPGIAEYRCGPDLFGAGDTRRGDMGHGMASRWQPQGGSATNSPWSACSSPLRSYTRSSSRSVRFQLRPRRSIQPSPTRPLAGLGGEVDHHHVPAIAASHVVSNAATRAVSGPGPGEEVTAGIVVGPAGHLEQLPVARPY